MEYYPITFLHLNSYLRVYFLRIQPKVIIDNNAARKSLRELLMYQPLFKVLHIYSLIQFSQPYVVGAITNPVLQMKLMKHREVK